MVLLRRASRVLLSVLAVYSATCAALDKPHFEVLYEGGKPKLFLDTEGASQFICDLFVLKKGTQAFHWASNDTVERRSKDGKVSPTEIQELVKTGTGQQGGGLYASLDPWDSSLFGTDVLVIDQKMDQLIAPWDKVQKTFSDRNIVNQELAAANIAGTMEGSDSITVGSSGHRYLNFITPNSLENTHHGSFSEMVAHLAHPELPYTEKVQMFNLLRAKAMGHVDNKTEQELTDQYPEIKKILGGEELSSNEIETLIPKAGSYGSWNLKVIFQLIPLESLRNDRLAKSYLRNVASKEDIQKAIDDLNSPIFSRRASISSEDALRKINWFSSLQSLEAIEACLGSQLKKSVTTNDVIPHSKQ
jgi:hypothetical protein